MIPYKKIENFKSLQISPNSNDEFFKKFVFYSELKNKMINREEL